MITERLDFLDFTLALSDSENDDGENSGQGR